MTDWDPETYLDMIRGEIPEYEMLQHQLVEATLGVDARDILELGTGSGETAARVLVAHPGARLCGIDSSEAMLDAARTALSAWDPELQLRRLEDPLPKRRFDLVVAALSVHHLEGSGKADLYERVAAALRPGGRLVVADVVVPDDPSDSITPIEEGYDFPSSIAEQLAFIAQTGLRSRVAWCRLDLAVLVGDAPTRGGEVSS